MRIIWDLWDNIKSTNTHIMGPWGIRERGRVWEHIWRHNSWKIPWPMKGNIHPISGSTIPYAINSSWKIRKSSLLSQSLLSPVTWRTSSFTHLWFPGGSDGKASDNVGDPGSIPASGRSPGKGNSNPLQYSCLENTTDRSLVGYSPYGRKESDTTERLHFISVLSEAWLCWTDSLGHSALGNITLLYTVTKQMSSFHKDSPPFPEIPSQYFHRFVFHLPNSFGYRSSPPSGLSEITPFISHDAAPMSPPPGSLPRLFLLPTSPR